MQALHGVREAHTDALRLFSCVLDASTADAPTAGEAAQLEAVHMAAHIQAAADAIEDVVADAHEALACDTDRLQRLLVAESALASLLHVRLIMVSG